MSPEFWMLGLIFGCVTFLVIAEFRRNRAATVYTRKPAHVVNPPAARRGNVMSDVPLTLPPMIDGVTLREWVTHHHIKNDNVWPSVVATFYTRAAMVPHIAEYFAGVDMDRLKNHFQRALMMVSGHGLTTGVVSMLVRRHVNVRNRAGDPITAEVYDAVISTLATVLLEHGVPERGVNALAESIAPLRAALLIRQA